MKSLFILSTLVLLSFQVALAQSPKYDPELATSLKADDYGMRKFVIAFLYRGEKVTEYTPEERAVYQKGHMENINLLAEKGKLILAGPFFGNEELRGLFFFDVETLEEAETLTQTDPAIKAGILRMELREWYGSAALMKIPEIHEMVQKKSF